MLKGQTVILRPIRDTDIDLLYAYHIDIDNRGCLLYTSPSPRDGLLSRMPSSA